MYVYFGVLNTLSVDVCVRGKYSKHSMVWSMAVHHHHQFIIHIHTHTHTHTHTCTHTNNHIKTCILLKTHIQYMYMNL